MLLRSGIHYNHLRRIIQKKDVEKEDIIVRTKHHELRIVDTE